MAYSDSSRVEPHTTDVPPHTFSDNPPHTSDADIVGAVDIVGQFADNTIDNHKVTSKTIDSRFLITSKSIFFTLCLH
ncbi:hypothetical protein Hanom_Chr00s161327g01825491 [Helianthus anomalus]